MDLVTLRIHPGKTMTIRLHHLSALPGGSDNISHHVVAYRAVASPKAEAKCVGVVADHDVGTLCIVRLLPCQCV